MGGNTFLKEFLAQFGKSDTILISDISQIMLSWACLFHRDLIHVVQHKLAVGSMFHGKVKKILVDLQLALFSGILCFFVLYIMAESM